MKKFLYVTFLFVLLFTIFELVNTFGLLESRGNANIEEPIGKWNITLNGIDITEEKHITADDLIYEGNENVESDYFAPGVSAGYEIVIDPNDTDVAIRYDVTADIGDLVNHPNISFAVSGDVTKKVVGDEVIYSGIIPLDFIERGEKMTIQTGLVWNNDEDYNELDNELNRINTSLEIIITIKFSQYLGEEL